MDSSQGETGGAKTLSSKLMSKVPHSRVKDKVRGLKSRLPGMKKHNGEEDAHEDSSEYDETSPRGSGPETEFDSPRDVQHPDFDSQNTNYVAGAPPTRSAPPANSSPRSHLAPALEEKFQNLGIGGNRASPRVDADSTTTDRGVQPEQQFSSPSTTENPQVGNSDVPRTSFRSTSMPASATTNKGVLEKVKDSVAGATAALGEKMGYYNDHTPADPNAPSILSKAKSTLGVDKPSDPNAPPLTERAKAYMTVATQKTREYSAVAADHAAWTKDRVAAQTTPTHHDKALSEEVTQTLSSLPGTIKEKVFGPASPSAGAPNSPGIVDRVSGAVTSLFSPKDASVTKPHSDNVAEAAASPADRRSVPERMEATASPTVNS